MNKTEARKQATEAAKEIKKFPSSSFKNIHGEKFTIYSNGVMVFMSGDEVNDMVNENKKADGIIQLFNDSFNIWSNDELQLLGEALIDVSKKITASIST